MELVDVATGATRVVLQAGLPNETNGTNLTNNTSGSIEQGSEEAVETATRILPEWIPQWSVQVALAIFALLLGWYGSKLLVRLLSRRVARRFRRPSVSQAVLRSIRVVVMFFAILTAAAFLGVGLSNILLSVTVLTAAIAVVIAPILGGFISGLFVLSDQSYEIGDLIEIVDTAEGTRGFVEDITFQYTKIFTLDNTSIVIPNGTIRERDVINYSAEDPRTRLSLDILVSYESDVALARKLIERAARGVDPVITGGPSIRIGSARYPAAPTCFINEYGDNGVLLTLRYWVKKPYTLLAVRSQIREKIWNAFGDADIEIPYPHQHIVFDESVDGLPVRKDNSPPNEDEEDPLR